MFRYYLEGIVEILLGRKCSDIIGRGSVQILLGREYLDIVGKELFKYYWEENDQILLGRNGLKIVLRYVGPFL